MHIPLKYLIPAILFFGLASCGNGSGETDQKKITIATAANMQFAMEELIKVFTEKTGIECDLVIGSSGKLTAQISEGAPYDIFVSANMKYPNEIFKKGLAVSEPSVYAYGKLVLWTTNDGIEPSLGILSSNKIEHIALANPKTAPYGIAAEEVLKKNDLLEVLGDKFVYGESISQTNQFITSGSANIGFTAKSVVLSPQMIDEGKWIEISDSLYSPIDQGIVLIKRDEGDLESAKEFKDFLFSEDAQEILIKFGYDINE